MQEENSQVLQRLDVVIKCYEFIHNYIVKGGIEKEIEELRRQINFMVESYKNLHSTVNRSKVESLQDFQEVLTKQIINQNSKIENAITSHFKQEISEIKQNLIWMSKHLHAIEKQVFKNEKKIKISVQVEEEEKKHYDGDITEIHIMGEIRKVLTDDEQYVINNYYGLEGRRTKKISEIADSMARRSQTVKTYHSKALQKIRRLEKTQKLHLIPSDELKKDVFGEL